jgi:hypothetical protein
MDADNTTLGRQYIKLYAGDYSSNTQIFAPPMAALLSAGSIEPSTVVTAKFEVTYTGFSDEAKRAFQAAVDVWSITLNTNVVIRINANWAALDDPRVLGQAGPEGFNRNFTGAPVTNVWFPVALANKIGGSDLTPGAAHISAEFNSNFSNWYFGIDGNTPSGKYDLMSVVLHEIGHGLGFVGSMNVGDDGRGSWGAGSSFPFIYDRFTENGDGQKLLDTTLFPNNSTQLAGQLQSTRLFFNGTRSRAANGNNRVPIYAPLQWEPGSSYSHLNESTFPAGNANSLMTPQIGMGESIHAAGAIGLAVLRDMGW